MTGGGSTDVVVIGLGPGGGEVASTLLDAGLDVVPVATLRTMIFAYPTFHRGVLDALAALC